MKYHPTSSKFHDHPYLTTNIKFSGIKFSYPPITSLVIYRLLLLSSRQPRQTITSGCHRALLGHVCRRTAHIPHALRAIVHTKVNAQIPSTQTQQTRQRICSKPRWFSSAYSALPHYSSTSSGPKAWKTDRRTNIMRKGDEEENITVTRRHHGRGRKTMLTTITGAPGQTYPGARVSITDFKGQLIDNARRRRNGGADTATFRGMERRSVAFLSHCPRQHGISKRRR